MRHTESEYINAGAASERAPTPDAARAHAQAIRVMLEAERPEDQTYACQMIKHGRWLTPGENPFTADAEHLHTFAQLVRLAEVDL